MSKQPPPAPTASTVGPCPTIIQISWTPRHWKFTQHHRTTRPHPNIVEVDIVVVVVEEVVVVVIVVVAVVIVVVSVVRVAVVVVVVVREVVVVVVILGVVVT